MSEGHSSDICFLTESETHDQIVINSIIVLLMDGVSEQEVLPFLLGTTWSPPQGPLGTAEHDTA